MSAFLRFCVSNNKTEPRDRTMSRETIPLRITAALIVYGWIGLLAIALVATSIGAKPHPQSSPIHKSAMASAPSGASDAASFRAPRHSADQAPTSTPQR